MNATVIFMLENTREDDGSLVQSHRHCIPRGDGGTDARTHGIELA